MLLVESTQWLDENAKSIAFFRNAPNTTELSGMSPTETDVTRALSPLVKAVSDLEQIRSASQNGLPPRSVIHRILGWAEDNQEAMTFYVFTGIVEMCQELRSAPFILEEEIDHIWDTIDDCAGPVDLLRHADEQVGFERASDTSFPFFREACRRIENIARTIPGADRGSIYVLSNPSFSGLLKIGKTTQSPEERAAELSGTSGVPTPFVVEYSRVTDRHSVVEEWVHRILAPYRESISREFFRLSVDEAVKTIESVIGEISRR